MITTRNNFSILLVTDLLAMISGGLIPDNITHGDNQKSDDGLKIYVKGVYDENIDSFSTKSELDNYIYSNGWTKPVETD